MSLLALLLLLLGCCLVVVAFVVVIVVHVWYSKDLTSLAGQRVAVQE